MKNFSPLIVMSAMALAAGCGPNAQMSRARSLEKKGKYYEAWEKYQEVAAKYPANAAAPEALFRAGWLAERQLKDCAAAGNFYDGVAARYPQADPWARLAALQKRNCPDYFPLLAGAEWVEGDSETKGKNARIEIVCKAPPEKSLPSEAGVLERTYYGGTAKFKTVDSLYKKTESELLEFDSLDDPRSKTILMWPLAAGTKWKTKSANRIFSYEIAASDKKISTAAGDFQNCLQVQFSIEGAAGVTNEYYAPGVGRVLTTIATKEGEKRNTELLSYKAGQFPDLQLDEGPK